MAGTDHFTKAQFEEALPKHKQTGKPLWECAGLLDGEYVYTMGVECKSLQANVRIEIRSSVGADGMAYDTGDNSIRAYLIYMDAEHKEWRPLGSKTQRWVTRQAGWEKRLTDMLRTLYGWRIKAGDCPVCHQPKGIFKVKKAGPNKGRVFARCLRDEHQKASWVWLTESKEMGK